MINNNKRTLRTIRGSTINKKRQQQQTKKQTTQTTQKEPDHGHESTLIFDSDSDSEQEPEIHRNKPTMKKTMQNKQKLRTSSNPQKLKTSGTSSTSNPQKLKTTSVTKKPTAKPANVGRALEIIQDIDKNGELSKEEIIEKLEIRRDKLPEEHKDIDPINYILKELVIEDRKEKIDNMNQTRHKQDLIVKRDKMKPEHFKRKADMTPSDYKEIGEDENLKIVLTSKKFFEKIKNYKTPPKNFRNPFMKNGTRGNRKIPKEFMNKINTGF